MLLNPTESRCRDYPILVTVQYCTMRIVSKAQIAFLLVTPTYNLHSLANHLKGETKLLTVV